MLKIFILVMILTSISFHSEAENRISLVIPLTTQYKGLEALLNTEEPIKPAIGVEGEAYNITLGYNKAYLGLSGAIEDKYLRYPLITFNTIKVNLEVHQMNLNTIKNITFFKQIFHYKIQQQETFPLLSITGKNLMLQFGQTHTIKLIKLSYVFSF